MCIRDSAKGVGRETGARVQIPLSPFSAYALKCIIKMDLKRFKKVLTNEQRFDKIIKLSQEIKTKNIYN